MKRIMVLWAFIAVMMVGGLTYLGIIIKNQNAPYLKLENDLVDKAMALVGEKPSLYAKNMTITADIFQENGYEVDLKVNQEKCSGYVEITSRLGVLKYDAYIKCKDYTTKGYKES